MRKTIIIFHHTPRQLSAQGLTMPSHDLLVAACILTLALVTSACPSSGATADLRSMLIGRCLEFSTFVNPAAVCDVTPSRPNCSAMADLFISAFAFQDVCNISVSRYDKFLEATSYPLPPDKSLFWGGVNAFVHQYSEAGARMVTLEDTLTGYMINLLSFCSAPDEPDGIAGPDTKCPGLNDSATCPSSALISFWTAASLNFASRARGTISIMLNASRVAFRQDSILSRYELPNIMANNVTEANILLVHAPGDEITETCQGPSIANLTRRLAAKNITATCRENPREILWLLCSDNPTVKECDNAGSVRTTSPLLVCVMTMVVGVVQLF
ncbi:ADP-ribosyl cyclase/cyclic ADP-ribose hydrolase-like [Pomacea canaliculata]|uniref:ADP-ribosyl cyclase/cyclic ADP-ribose hydrolase-like n=1 Tax=Pomacea canaliculata TaxID=400727 RepID=UPI000D736FF4|nr:ADP-ribosyl cyclase/cyclic ADP-ribose hydrolase-like [Pomacea canaliculata]XP_025080004.1 ADP-ribosyl cyclase/cyclic ADP-ribose hydrolase-like [Pomacea canaliculata]XP_025080005.1 ADP-ribosyl cyclase/cyclic ADP-ribose hydrolase-like [Pomacea canaliculata]